MALNALQSYLLQRGLPTTPALWKPGVALIGDLVEEEGRAGVTALRLGRVLRRFFSTAAGVLRDEAPMTADKLLRASCPLDAALPCNPRPGAWCRIDHCARQLAACFSFHHLHLPAQ